MGLFNRKPQASYEEQKIKALIVLKQAQAELCLRKGQELASLNEKKQQLQSRYKTLLDEFHNKKG